MKTNRQSSENRTKTNRGPGQKDELRAPRNAGSVGEANQGEPHLRVLLTIEQNYQTFLRIAG
jgi:hypothetical protein